MRFNSRQCFFSAALVVAVAAHADSAVSGMGRSADPELTLRAAAVALDHDAGQTYARGADAQAAPCVPEAVRATPMAADRAEKSGVSMVAQDGVNPDLQKIWSGP
jgi:hypothetical protein